MDSILIKTLAAVILGFVISAVLGKYLVHRVDGVPLCGRITETEAYIGRMDKACHAYGYKPSRRTDPPGTCPNRGPPPWGG